MNFIVTWMRPLFKALIRIEKKLDEVMREQKESQNPNRVPGLTLTQPMSAPGQNPCGLCQKIPTYRNIQVAGDEPVTMRFCDCEPHIEKI